MKHTALCTHSRAFLRDVPTSRAWTAPRVPDSQRALLTVGDEEGLMCLCSLDLLELQDSSDL